MLNSAWKKIFLSILLALILHLHFLHLFLFFFTFFFGPLSPYFVCERLCKFKNWPCDIMAFLSLDFIIISLKGLKSVCFQEPNRDLALYQPFGIIKQNVHELLRKVIKHSYSAHLLIQVFFSRCKLLFKYNI